MHIAALITWLVTALGGFYLLGTCMLARWIPVHRAQAAAVVAAGPAGEQTVPAERLSPVPVVLGHGMFAVITLVLVLLSALDIGGK